MRALGAAIRGGLTRGITRNVVALGIVSLLTDVSSEMLVYLIPLFLANVLLASPSIIGVIEGIAESAAALLKLVSGVISDRLHRRRLLVGIGYGSSVASKALFLAATSWPIVLVARLGDRIGKGIRTSPRDALIADSTPPEARGVAFGLHRALDTAGAVVGVAVAALVVASSQGSAVVLGADTFRLLVLVALVPGVLAVVAIVVGVHDVPRRAHDRAEANAVPSRAASLVRAVATWRLFPMSFWLFVVASGLFALGNSSDAFLSLRSQQLGVDVRDLLLIIVAFNLANALVSWPVGALSDRVGRRTLVAIAWAIYAVAYAGFALAGSAASVALLWILYGTYYGVNEAVGRALVADLAPTDLRATGYGIVNAVVGLLVLPASIVAGLLWDRIAPDAPFWFGAGCAAAALVLLVVAVRPARHLQAQR
ncbi:MAG TPA: MFS transporter [Candidatus Limnocylindrales bacterium]|jgi:MFS family permease|nr:MFS transporter [Candidatus Limnocylindrales bacterium]